MIKPTLKKVLTEMIKKELKSFLSETSSSVSSLSPGAQKALEQSKIAKQNKDVQKKRAAAKDSMRGISVEGCEPELEEQNIRIPGDKRQTDEFDFFDTSEFHDEGEFEGWQDPDQQDDFWPEDESVRMREQRMFDDDTDDADIFSNSTEEKFFSAKAPTRVPEKSLSVDELESSLGAPEGEINIDWNDSDGYDYLSDKSVTPLDPAAQDRFAQAEWDEDEAEFERSGGSRRMDMELEQVDKPKQPVSHDYEATDAEWDALKGEQEYQAGLDDERDERAFQRSGGGRRADWEWQY